jgi:hypothetical protein
MRPFAPLGRPVRRHTFGLILLAVGLLLVVLAIGTVAYAQWVEWQHRLHGPAGPQETLPARLEDEAAGALDLRFASPTGPGAPTRCAARRPGPAEIVPKGPPPCPSQERSIRL